MKALCEENHITQAFEYVFIQEFIIDQRLGDHDASIAGLLEHDVEGLLDDPYQVIRRFHFLGGNKKLVDGFGLFSSNGQEDFPLAGK